MKFLSCSVPLQVLLTCTIATLTTASALKYELTRRTIDGKLCATETESGLNQTACSSTPAPDGATGRDWCYTSVADINKQNWAYCEQKTNYANTRKAVKSKMDIIQSNLSQMVSNGTAINKNVLILKDRFSSLCDATDVTTDSVQEAQYLLTELLRFQDTLEESVASIAEVERHLERSGKSETVSNVKATHENGLKAEYFANPVFAGRPTYSKTIPSLELSLDAPPTTLISPSEYSMRAQGFLAVPETGEYIFRLETDCGARLFINDSPTIVYGMPMPSVTTKSVSVPLETSLFTNRATTTSKPLFLYSGEKVKVTMEVIHLNQFKRDETIPSQLTLFWKRGDEREQRILPSFFYLQDAPTSLKLSGFNPKDLEVSTLSEGQQAFYNNDAYFLADIPAHLHGLRLLRPRIEHDIEKLRLVTNRPTILFIASPEGEQPPLASEEYRKLDLEDTGELLSVYHATSNSSRAVGSTLFTIRQKDLEGNKEHVFQVIQPTPFILFFGEKQEPRYNCGGEKHIVSLPTYPAYLGCESSSALSSEYDCESGFSGQQLDRPNGVWKTNSDSGVGEYLTLYLSKPVRIIGLEYKPLNEQVSWPSELAIGNAEYERTTETIQLSHGHGSAHNTFLLSEPFIAQSVKIQIQNMHQEVNSGGSFSVIATECIGNPSNEEAQIIRLEECTETLKTVAKDNHVEKGDVYSVVCPAECINSPEGNVYGTDAYSLDSTLCATALHAGLCTSNNEDCSFQVTVSGPTAGFEGTFKNSVASGNREKSTNSMLLTKLGDTSYEHEKGFRVIFNPVAQLPLGTIADYGHRPSFSHGIFYGWNKIMNQSYYEHEIDEMRGYKAHGITVLEDFETENREPTKWTLNTHENGDFKIKLKLGSNGVGNGEKACVIANGKKLIDSVPIKHSEYYDVEGTVQVKDRAVELTFDCNSSEGEKTSFNTNLVEVLIEKKN